MTYLILLSVALTQAEDFRDHKTKVKKIENCQIRKTIKPMTAAMCWSI